MKLSSLAVNRPIAVLMAVLTVILLGIVSLSKLTIDLYPKMTFPIAVVAANYPGSSPQEVENLVTRPLEEALGTVNNVKEIRSFSQPGSSMVMIEFNWGSDMDFATLQMREKVDFVKGFLPEDVSTPQVLKFDPASMPIFKLAISGGENLVDLRRVVDDTIKIQLERQNGVASVGVSGGQNREIQIKVDPNKLSHYGLNLNQITQVLAADNMDFSAGSLREGIENVTIRVTGQFKTIDDIENLILMSSTGNAIQLKEIAAIEDTYQKISQTSYMNGVPSIGIDIQKQTDANTVQVSNQVLKAIENMKKDLPENIEVNIIFDQAQYIKESIKNVTINALVGGLLAVAILYLFLRNIRTTLVIGIAMPISIIATFTMIYFGGLTLNMLSLGGLALGVGMMVDSAIVILENIFRYRQQGYNNIDAAKQGAAEVGTAVIASSLTTVAVFLPIVFVQGLAAELFRPLALTVSFALIASLLVALTLIPMLSSKLLEVQIKAKEGKGRGKAINAFGRFFEKLNGHYARALKWSINRKKTVVALVTAGFIASLALVPIIGTEFIPKMDQGEIIVDITLPRGTILSETNRIVGEVESRIASIPEVKNVFTSVGSGGAMDFSGRARTNIGNINLKLVPLSERNRSSEAVAEEIRKKVQGIAGAEIEVSEMDASAGGMSSPLEISVLGQNLEVLKELSNAIIKEAEKVEGVRELESSFTEGISELDIKVKRDVAALNGLNTATIAQTTRAAFLGQVATTLKTGSDEINVRVMMGDATNKTIEDIRNLKITTPMGSTVFIEEVADVEITQGPSSINRKGQTRIATVNGNIVDRDLGSVTKDLQLRLNQMPLPEGYSIQFGGQAQDMAEAFGDLTLALILAIILVYIIMAAQFEALLYPFIIMFSLPTTFIGIVFGLAVTGRSLSIPAFIGVIMLAGIVVNNAIVLVDYINTLRKRGMSRDEAILEAGPTRLRPIMMTALTTVLGLIPLTLGLGEGSEVQAPMATVVVFGLTFSTLITLIFVPVIYIIFDDLGEKLKGRARGLFGIRRSA